MKVFDTDTIYYDAFSGIAGDATATASCHVQGVYMDNSGTATCFDPKVPAVWHVPTETQSIITHNCESNVANVYVHTYENSAFTYTATTADAFALIESSEAIWPLVWHNHNDYLRAQRRHDLRQQIHSHLFEWPKNHLGNTVRARFFNPDYSSESELSALNLLKSMLDRDQWRRYLSYGFFMIRGKSGLRYQIFRGRKPVHVYSVYGLKLAEVCVDTRVKVPPSDHAIMKLMLVGSDEAGFWNRGNIYPRHSGVSVESVFGKEMVEAA